MRDKDGDVGSTCVVVVATAVEVSVFESWVVIEPVSEWG